MWNAKDEYELNGNIAGRVFPREKNASGSGTFPWGYYVIGRGPGGIAVSKERAKKDVEQFVSGKY